MDAALFMLNASIALKSLNGMKFVIIAAHAQNDHTSVNTVKGLILSMKMFRVITGQIVIFTQYFVRMGVQRVFLAKMYMIILPTTAL